MDEIFTVDLTITTYCQIDGEDFVHFCGLLRKRELYLLIDDWSEIKIQNLKTLMFYRVINWNQKLKVKFKIVFVRVNENLTKVKMSTTTKLGF